MFSMTAAIRSTSRVISMYPVCREEDKTYALVPLDTLSMNTGSSSREKGREEGGERKAVECKF